MASPPPRLPHRFWIEKTPLPDASINRGLLCPTSAQMMAMLGNPNGERARTMIATESVGPFRATGLKPALASLRVIFAQVRRDFPDLYGLIRNNGMHVIRHTRGRTTFSNHAWGIAIDFIVGNVQAPPLGATYSYRGLDALAPYFNKAGWYWGGGYRNITRKDPMHFECGLALMRNFGL